MRKQKSKASARPGFYPTYPFRDRDPAMDELLSIVDGYSPTAICLVANISPGLLARWKVSRRGSNKRTTRRPQHATLAAVAGAFGFEYKLTQRRKSLVTKKRRGAK